MQLPHSSPTCGVTFAQFMTPRPNAVSPRLSYPFLGRPGPSRQACLAFFPEIASLPTSPRPALLTSLPCTVCGTEVSSYRPREGAALRACVRRAPSTAGHAVMTALVSRVPSRASPLAGWNPSRPGARCLVSPLPRRGPRRVSRSKLPLCGRPGFWLGFCFAAQDSASTFLRPGQQWAIHQHKNIHSFIRHLLWTGQWLAPLDSGIRARSAF